MIEKLMHIQVNIYIKQRLVLEKIIKSPGIEYVSIYSTN